MTLDLASLIERLTGEDKAQLEQIVAQGVTEKWIPQVGPQTDAYFSKADELLYGGSAGGGKSDLLIGLALNEAHNAVIFRNGLGNVRDLENRAVAVEGHRDGFSQNIHYWNRGDGRTLEFGSLEQPGSEESWQGRRRDFMGFDEAAQQMKARIQFVLGWAGSAKAGARTRVIFATNPPLSDEGNWLIVWFAPWLDPMYPNPAKPGELRWFVNNKEGDPVWVKGSGRFNRDTGEPADALYEELIQKHGADWQKHSPVVISQAKTRTFIPSSLADNKYLRDTDYRSRVESLPEPMRSAMLNGNFMAARVDHQFQIFPSDWVREAQARWTPDGRKQAMLSLGVDVAGGGKDREVIARLHSGNWFDVPIVHQGKDTKDGFAVAGRILAAQRRGAPIALDMTGGWGGGPKTALRASGVDATGCVFSEKSGAVDPVSQIPFYNLRAEIMWHFRLALDPAGALVQGHPEDIALPPDPRLLAEMTTPRWSLSGGSILVEGKEEIKKRLGVSTDLLDAYMIAWWIRSKGIVRQQNVDRRQSGQDSPPEADPFAVDGF